MIYFPHPLLVDDEGILAIGGDLSVERLKLAYAIGVFPWYNQPPIIWWFTNPRCVLYPSDIIISKSLRSPIIKNDWNISVNRSFDRVVEKCSTIKRKNQSGTWITREIYHAFLKLHSEGKAHSLEVWNDKELIGGLYGVVHGKIFYGESMFSKVSDASKFGLVYLCKYLEFLGCDLIDCQQDTPHMRRMGASLMEKTEFWNIVKANILTDDMNFGFSTFDKWINDTNFNFS